LVFVSQKVINTYKLISGPKWRHPFTSIDVECDWGPNYLYLREILGVFKQNDVGGNLGASHRAVNLPSRCSCSGCL
jgi:hypothetical protein